MPSRAALPAAFAAAAFFTLLGWGRSAGAAEAAAEASRPNVLFCIADDWSFPHAGAYGDPVVKTPAFDRVAREGVLFTRSFCAAPSCSPSRAALLTGRYPHALGHGANLWGSLPAKYAVYPDLLEAAGYHVGLQGKGWGPGQLGERKRNPAGPGFPSFERFLASVPQGKPFCFWYGSGDPHRPYVEGSGAAAGMNPRDVKVPAFLPDTPEVRGDVLDYFLEVQRFDESVGRMLALLESSGRLHNTIVIITSDNGMPFPRAKTNLYDSGCRMPLAVRWGARVKGGQKCDAFVSHADVAPTLLEAAGVRIPEEVSGRSLMDLLVGVPDNAAPYLWDKVYFERERHANVRQGDVGYPARAVRTDKFLYVRNFKPDRWPAGDPKMWFAVGPFGDIDGGISKDVVLRGRDEADENIARYYRLAAAKRPGEELYDVEKDPDQLKNVAGEAEYAERLAGLRADLEAWMKRTRDPRAPGGDPAAADEFDRYPYYGGGPGDARGATPATRPGRANRPATRPVRR